MPKQQYTIQTTVNEDGSRVYAVQVWRLFRPFGNDRSYWQDVALCDSPEQAQGYIDGQELGLTYAQWSALRQIYDGNPISGTKAACTKLSKALSEKGLVGAGPYYQQWVLTDKGRSIVHALLNAKPPRVPNRFGTPLNR